MTLYSFRMLVVDHFDDPVTAFYQLLRKPVSAFWLIAVGVGIS
jgi:hypothetical protein